MTTENTQARITRNYGGCTENIDTWCWLNRNGCFEISALSDEVAAFPPAELMYNVSGLRTQRDFASHGVDFYRALSAVASKDLASYHSILDFGCGVGRLLRMLKGHPGEIHGCDIDSRHIQWVNDGLPFVKAVTSRTKPPLPYESNSFDAIISISIFTHLNQASQNEFLADLSRIAKPGSELFLTIHGSTALRRALDEPDIFAMLDIPRQALDTARQHFEAGEHAFILQQGHLTTTNGSDLIDGPFEYGITFIPEEYVRNTWAKWFDVLNIVKGGIHDFQDIVCLRAKS
jgi:SAM-dependent methyltransferase